MTAIAAQSGRNNPEPIPAPKLLEVTGLRTYFTTPEGPARAVDGVDLSIDHGEILSLVGESGCGKTVTALSIMGLIESPGQIMTGTKVVLDGLNLTALPERALTSVRGGVVAMIFQEPMTALNPIYPIGAQIVEAIRLHTNLRGAQVRRRAVELLELARIASPERHLKSYPHELSGGMRQRALIAMALAGNPKLLIADEPTTALDVTTQAELLDLLRELRDSLRMAILLITHDFGVVAETADNVGVMYGGRIVEYGPAEAVLTSPRHPYAEALLRSVPVLGASRDRPLCVIPGTVADPRQWPPGCRFSPRCDQAFTKCTAEQPPLFRLARQSAACWLCEEHSGSGQSREDQSDVT